MKKIFVLAEHRQGQIREITYEMLTKGRELAEDQKANLTAILMGEKVENQAKSLSEHADRVFILEDVMLKNFNSITYHKALSKLILEYEPLLTLIGQTAYGADLAPSLATALNLPLATDCIDLWFEGDDLRITRQIYGGKVNATAKLKKSRSYIITIRQAAFTAKNMTKKTTLKGEIVDVPFPLKEDTLVKHFIEYVSPVSTGVDISASDIIVGVGRGIKDSKNIPIAEDLAVTLGGVLACSRPIVDKGWLPSDRQVGTSGKTVKPKLYIAVGISGAFQHVLGMKNSELVIAINKDPNAPIFNYADFSIIDDLFKILPAIKNKVVESQA
jgi:electron transfer flavoprotein alpha subunit